MSEKARQDARYLAAARQHGAMIERLARGYEADAELRRDLVQEIHAALWRSFAIFEGQCAERSWVHRIAHNVAVTHMMTGKRRRKMALVGLEQIEELAGGDDPEHSTGLRSLSDRLLATIHRLAPADRQVMLLYLDQAYDKFRKEGRMNSMHDLQEAVEEGAVKRIRPKMMTVMAILLGLLPIMAPKLPCSRSWRRSTLTSRSVSWRSTILSSRIFRRCGSIGFVR